ncbi:MAG: hypothetical protein R2932_48815 [Caldilineaceae bacterium]
MFSINLMVWNGQIGAAELAVLPQLRAMGYDGVEVPIFAPEGVDIAALAQQS